MRLKDISKKLSSLNILILLTLFLLGFAIFYYLYNWQRSQAEVFVKVNLIRQKEIPIYDAPYNWIPYQVGEAVKIGDKEISPFGGVNAEIVDKEAIEGRYAGQLVYLLLKVNATKDRSGIYLFKNKPVSVGSIIDLKLPQAQVQGFVTYIGRKKPSYNYQKLLVTIKGKQVDPWIADNLKIDSVIVDNKDQVVAKVLDKKVTASTSVANLAADSNTGRAVLSYDKTKKDLEAKIEILADKGGDIYYFLEWQKVKVGENLYLPFKELSLSIPIIEISEPVK